MRNRVRSMYCVFEFMLFLKILVCSGGSESSNKVYDMAAQHTKLTNGKIIIVHAVAPPILLGGGLVSLVVYGIGRIRIDLKEAGRRILQNYSEK